MPTASTPVQLPEVRPGHHICCLYQEPQELDTLLVSFLRQGIDRGEKVVYVMEDHNPAAVVQKLRAGGLDVASPYNKGQFVLMPLEQAYLQGGRFEPDRMIELLRAETARAVAEGYPAMRFKGETGWAIRDAEGARRLIEYESRLSDFFPTSQCAAICPYDRGRFEAPMLLDVLTTHPEAVIGTAVCDNFYFMPAREFLGPDRAAAMLRHWLENLHARHHVEKEIVRLNRGLAVRTDELEASNKELEAFAYSVSHDLRAPLRAIEGFANILITEYAGLLSEKPRHYLQLVSDNVHEMTSLIDALLRFSRTNRQVLTKETVNPAEIVRRCLQELYADQEGRPIEARVGELPPCEADPTLLKQVWFNLLANAFKFTRGRDPARIEVGSRAEVGETVYYVKDNGVGFDMQYADKLFGVFQRLHSVAEYEGTGIGLALVQRIVHRHGGRVWAEAAPEQGATFSFTLGRSAPHA